MSYYTPLRQIREIADEDMVDVVGGPMNLDDLVRELRTTMIINTPEYMVITIDKDRRVKKYRVTMYIPKEDFGKEERK